MADRSSERQGCADDAARQDSSGRGAVDPRLPLQSHDAKGDSRGADLRTDRKSVETFSSVSGEAAGRSAQRRGRPARQDADAGDGGRLRGRDDGSINDRQGRGADLLQPLEETGDTIKSDVEDRYRQAPGKAVAEDSAARLRDGNDLLEQLDGLVPQQLVEATQLSLKHCIDILNMKYPNQKSQAFAAVMRAKSHASNTALTLAARIDETHLKRQQLGRLPDLLKIIQDEENRARLIEHMID
jgi:hypothetical protein